MSALTLSKLESHLWEAANILRGPVDAADFKTYVFPLLFFSEFYTPRSVVRLMVNILDPREGESVYDPTDVEGIARLVTLDEIAANDHNLNIPRYVEPKITSEVLTVEEAIKRQRESAAAAFAAEGKLVGILKREGLLA